MGLLSPGLRGPASPGETSPPRRHHPLPVLLYVSSLHPHHLCRWLSRGSARPLWSLCPLPEWFSHPQWASLPPGPKVETFPFMAQSPGSPLPTSAAQPTSASSCPPKPLTLQQSSPRHHPPCSHPVPDISQMWKLSRGEVAAFHKTSQPGSVARD